MSGQNSLFTRNKFRLGLFSANCSSGMAVTKIPERWVNSWENNLKMAQIADKVGLDFLLPIARWVGYGGETNFHGSVLETMTWAAGLLAKTEHINVFATIHTAFNHPGVVAKQIATIDQLSKGRAGLNVVCGWNKPEYDAFGLDLPQDHETRYRYGQEWFDIVSKLWTHPEPFDWDGEFFKLKNTYGDPQPVRGTVPIFNAAGSKEGREFATNNADFLFTSMIELEKSKAEIAELKGQAAAKGRDVGVLTFSYVVCRPTQKEAEEFHQYYARDNADWQAVDNIINLMFQHAQSFPPEMLQALRNRFAGGHGGVPLVGTPEVVAQGLIDLYEAGFGGTTLAFVNYAEELPYFAETVLPILEERGIRVPAQG
ncbi:LLM class flavin-dependent oxidoreductase [Luteithermobacter gelatinilyticus]|uniref:LLM class flavin-dependent oxidoreductase n=1 Tax=Luteithermobacter gelatinilyticus TaxID=2582913 RepID=UPI001105D1A3|nr:LLM class flavin-dependent oxidoreductase [Luteithermobacter gelatinilyticus]